MSNKQVFIIESKMFYTKKRIMIIFGTKYYFDKNGKLHRKGDKPALKTLYGTKHYYKHGKYHRDGDKPAVIWRDGSIEYWKNGQRHRDGKNPAIIRRDGSIEYWKNGVEYKEEEPKTRFIKRVTFL